MSFVAWAHHHREVVEREAGLQERRRHFEAAAIRRHEEAVFATPGALEADTVAIVEAPIDALSLARCGLPAIATRGWDPEPTRMGPTSARRTRGRHRD